MRYCPLLISILLIVSCKKEKLAEPINIGTLVQTRFDTIKPGPYLPVYPGSWWKYVNLKGDTIIDSVGVNYVKDSFELRSPNCELLYKSQVFFVPVYYSGGRRRLIWGYQEHLPPAQSSPSCADSFTTIVSDSLPIGSVIAHLALDDNSTADVSIGFVDLTVEIKGKEYYPTIIVICRSNSPWRYPVSSTFYSEHYTKNVGCISAASSWPYQPNDVWNLVDYFINKK